MLNHAQKQHVSLHYICKYIRHKCMHYFQINFHKQKIRKYTIAERERERSRERKKCREREEKRKLEGGQEIERK